MIASWREAWCPATGALLDRDGFGEVAGLVDVTAAAHSDVIGEQLQWNDFQQRRKQLGRWGNFDYMVGCLARKVIAGSDDGDDNAVAGAHLLNVGDALFVKSDGLGITFIVSRKHNDRKVFVDQRVGAMLHFA